MAVGRWGLWLAAFLLLAVALVLATAEELPVQDSTAAVVDIQRGAVIGASMDDEGVVRLVRSDGDRVEVAGWAGEELFEALQIAGIRVERERRPVGVVVFWVVGAVVVVLAGVLWWRRRVAAQSGGLNLATLRNSPARRVAERDVPERFSDVGGADEAKARLQDAIDFLKEPARWEAAGVRMPRGVLLEGPPGCGKTLLARAVAGEAGVPYFHLSASELVEVFVGVGAARVRSLFEEAGKVAPAVIFLDEIDAVGRRRGVTQLPGFAEWEQTLNQLLVCMDGFEKGGRVVVLAATNRGDVLDPALLRPGRFDSRVTMGSPGLDDRRAILGIHTRGKPVRAVDLDAVARMADGLTGAQLELLCNEAAIRALRRGGDATDDDFADALARCRALESRVGGLDRVLLDSETVRVEPSDELWMCAALRDGPEVRGRVLWADRSLIKVRTGDGREVVVPKGQLVTVEAIPPEVPS